MPRNLFPNDDPSAAAQAARLLFVNPQTNADIDDDENAPLFSMSVRIPATHVARLTVLARHSNVSRNAMTQLVLKAGFESIFSLLPSEFAQEMQEEIMTEYASNL